MKRLLRISLDMFLMSAIPIFMWILLGIVIDKNIANVFILTYPIQYATSFILAIFGIGPNVNAIKNNKKNLVDSNIILGCFVGLFLMVFLIFNVDEYIKIMSMDIETYRLFCIYSIILLFLQLVLQLICQKLYYQNENKKSNKLTIVFNIINIILILSLSIIINQTISIIITLIIDALIVLGYLNKYIKDKICFKFEIIKNMKYVSNEILDRLGMFIIYFVGWKNTLEFGTMYLVAINFETLIMDTQWDMSNSIITAATIDASKDELNYKESKRSAYKLVSLLVISSLIMGAGMYVYYKPELWLVSIFVGIQFFNIFALPNIWIKKQYCQINYSPKLVTTNEFLVKTIRIISSFLPTPFCTYIGQVLSMIYQFIMYNIVYRKKFIIKDEMLKMK